MFRAFLMALAACGLLAGCSDTAKEKNAGTQTAPRKAVVARTSTKGRWQLMHAEQAVEKPLVLLDVTEGDKAEATLVAVVPAFEARLNPDDKLKVSEATITPTTVSVTLTSGPVSVSFEGELRDGDVVGTLELTPLMVLPARLVATEAKSLKEAQPSPIFAFDQFRQALGGRGESAPILAFAEKNPTSPVALYAYELLLSRSREFKLDEKQVREIVEKYEKVSSYWGKRLGRIARARAAVGLVQSSHHPRLALELLDQIEKTIDDAEHPLVKALAPSKATATAIVAAEERQKKIEAAAERIETGTDEERQKAADELAELAKGEELNPHVHYALARFAEQKGNADEAIDRLAQLAAFPTIEALLQNEWAKKEIDRPAPSETLEKLWVAKNGSKDGLDARLDETFRERLYFFAKDKVEPRTEEGGQNVLIELFTGSHCPPCVGPDVALGGVERVFDRKEVVVLRYHQHIPRHDQLCNSDAEGRFMYYEGRATPTLAINGIKSEGAGGPVFGAPSLFQQLREAVSTVLKEKTDVRLEVTAEARDGALHLSAKATGLPKEVEGLRLRVALAEEEIHYAASNGIRSHEMVVRAMPATPAGVAPAADGSLSYEGTLKLDDFRRTLVDYLAQYEEQNNITFKEKPLALDKLHFIAFVQRDKKGDPNDKQVLQVKSIPVTGKIEYVKDKAPTPDKGTEPPKQTNEKQP